MAKHDIRFEQDPALDGVEIVVRAPERTEEVEALLRALGASRPGPLTVYSDAGMVRALPQEKIVTVMAEGKLVRVVSDDGVWFVRRTLQSLEEELDPGRFVRVSRFELVNLDKVRQYDFTVAGTLRLELAGGMETWASRRCIPAIRKLLKNKEV